jgi:hypothetical protein
MRTPCPSIASNKRVGKVYHTQFEIGGVNDAPVVQSLPPAAGAVAVQLKQPAVIAKTRSGGLKNNRRRPLNAER